MAQATFSIRMDTELKKQFDLLCEDFGMTATTAFNIFAKAVVKNGRIPFPIESQQTAAARQKAIDAVIAMREHALQQVSQGISQEEINEEIRLARLESSQKTSP